MDAGSASLLDHFAALADPCRAWKLVEPLAEILLLVLCATMAGAEDFVEVRRWGTMNRDFLRRFLPYADGIASHDTLNDTFNALDGELFAQCFSDWVESLREGEPDIVAIDGKTSRRTHDRTTERNPLHLVSAWASRQRLVLGRQACEAKSNEITAIPLLLDRLALKGALVTIDAMGCHGLPDQDRAKDPRQGRRLPARGKGKLAQSAPRDRTLLRRAARRSRRAVRNHRWRPWGDHGATMAGSRFAGTSSAMTSTGS